jgi:hypothetical protein
MSTERRGKAIASNQSAKLGTIVAQFRLPGGLTLITNFSAFSRATARLVFCALLLNLLVTTIPRSAIAKPISNSQQTQTIERLVHLKPPRPDESRYGYVPFAVPSNTLKVNVSYQYDRTGGTNTIDIGLFDARSSGSDNDHRGFRGWSGGRRSEFFISQNEATPGYLPGAMPAGTWHIILGLYRVVPSGVDVKFKISITTAAGSNISRQRVGPLQSAKEPSSPSNITDTKDLRWWGGDLHMHTIHSDGDWTIDGLLATARSRGLDFICITDHNTSSHHAEIDRLAGNSSQPLVLRGEEITTYGGHTNAWGLPSGTWIDFRVAPKDSAAMLKVAETVHHSKGLISINHPFANCGGCSWTYDSAVNGFDAIEVWNGDWDLADDLAVTMWDKLLQSGRHVTAIGSSDSHRSINPIGQPTTHVAARLKSQKALLDAIRAGRVYLTRDVTVASLNFEAELVDQKSPRWTIGDEIRLRAPAKIRFLVSTDAPSGATISLVSNGQILHRIPSNGERVPKVIEVDCLTNSYYRIEVRDEAKKTLALSNPIYAKLLNK